jgi:hypothetical protein
MCDGYDCDQRTGHGLLLTTNQPGDDFGKDNAVVPMPFSTERKRKCGQFVFDAYADGAFSRETDWTPLTFLRPIRVAPWEWDRRESGRHCCTKRHTADRRPTKAILPLFVSRWLELALCTASSCAKAAHGNLSLSSVRKVVCPTKAVDAAKVFWSPADGQ